MGEQIIRIPIRWENGKPVSHVRFTKTHEKHDVCELGCVIHNRTPHHMQYWPLHWRSDRGIFERLCPHGVGHPDPDQFPYWKSTSQEAQGVHGCCGCCRTPQYCVRCGRPHHHGECLRGDK